MLRRTEESLALAECFDPGHSDCRVAGTCVLQEALSRALEAFLAVLDEYTLADLLRPRNGLARVLLAADPRTRGPGRRGRA